MTKLPTLSDGRTRQVSAKRYAELERLAKADGKKLKEWLELGGHLKTQGARPA